MLTLQGRANREILTLFIQEMSIAQVCRNGERIVHGIFIIKPLRCDTGKNFLCQALSFRLTRCPITRIRPRRLSGGRKRVNKRIQQPGRYGFNKSNPRNNRAYGFSSEKNLPIICLLLNLDYDRTSALSLLERWLTASQKSLIGIPIDWYTHSLDCSQGQT